MAKEQVRFPAFRCPNPACGARRIIFAADRQTKNRARLFLYDELADRSAVEFILVCPKCRQRIAVCGAEGQHPHPALAT